MTKKDNKTSNKNSAKEKGALLESIIANLHKVPNVEVQKNVYLPVRGSSARKREIDVLLTSQVAGYPVRIAFECKNLRKPVGAPKIDAFIGKLDDIGIASNHGIYVSANGYTKGAIERAREAGIKPLLLRGLGEEGLARIVAQAFQSVVYLFLELIRTQITNEVSTTIDSYEMLTYYNEQGEISGILPNIIWQKWIQGEIPSSIGEHKFKINLPSEWHQVINGERYPASPVTTTILVSGLLFNLSGKVHHFSLMDASDKKLKKQQLNVSFDESAPSSPVTPILSEADLEKFTSQKSFVKVISRFRLPRIRTGPLFWPPSQKAINKVKELYHDYESGKISDPRPIDIRDIEGADLKSIWEPYVYIKP